MLVKDRQSGRMQRAPLKRRNRIHPTVAQIIAEDLKSGITRGKSYVQRLERERNELEGQIRMATRSANQTGSAEDIRVVRQLQGMLDRVEGDWTPSMAENLRYFKGLSNGLDVLQVLLNFAGRQNDFQGHGDFIDGNWLSGIKSIDAERIGNQAQLTGAQEENKGYNRFYYLPLILGLIGLLFQAFRDPKQFLVVAALFVLTGIAIVVYLNQYPFQPRERDYAFVGSFYAYAIWIGLGALALYEWSRQLKALDAAKALGTAGAVTVVLYGLEAATSGYHAMSLPLDIAPWWLECWSGWRCSFNGFRQRNSCEHKP